MIPRTKYLLAILFFICFSLLSFGQLESKKIFNTTNFKKGFYKNYQEFINNAPSIIKDFTVIEFRKSATDTTIISGDYQLKDSSEKISSVWGFCDGHSIYVSYNRSLLKKRYWKLEYVGPYSIFSFVHKDIYGFGPPLISIITIAASAAAPPETDLMVVNDRGKCVFPDIDLVRKMLSNQPDLLKEYKTEIEPYKTASDEFVSDEKYNAKMDVIKKYLIKLNERLQ